MTTYYTLAKTGKRREAVRAVRENNGLPPSLIVRVKEVHKARGLVLLVIIVK